MRLVLPPTLFVPLLLAASCQRPTAAPSPAPPRASRPAPAAGGRADAAVSAQKPEAEQARGRAVALGVCLQALEQADPSQFVPLLGACIGEVQPYPEPACNKAWAAAAAADPAVRVQLIARACAKACCPGMDEPKPRLCSSSPRIGMSEADWLELHLRALGPALFLKEEPALKARLSRALAACLPVVRVIGPSSQPAPPPPQSLRIVVRPDGSYVLDGKVLQHKALGPALALAHKKRQVPDAAIVIMAHPKTPYRIIVRLMDAAKAAGFQNMVFSTAEH